MTPARKDALEQAGLWFAQLACMLDRIHGSVRDDPGLVDAIGGCETFCEMAAETISRTVST